MLLLNQDQVASRSDDCVFSCDDCDDDDDDDDDIKWCFNFFLNH